MTWHLTGDAAEFLTATGPFLTSRPAENTLLLTVAETVRASGRRAFGDADPFFAWWHAADGTVGGACLQTPPRAMLLSEAPQDAVTSLVEVLTAAGRPLSELTADRATAEAFAATWQRRTGASASTGAGYRLYRLGELVDPRPPVPGAARVAGQADLDLLVHWWKAFHRDIGEHPSLPREVVADRVGHGDLRIWEVDGEPVAMAGSSRPMAGMVRILGVYTPAEHRRRGYAAAVTAAVSRAALQAGATQVVLYADLANPTSNGVYLRLGYRPVQDRIAVSFRC